MLLHTRTHRDGTGYYITLDTSGLVTGTVLGRRLRTDRVGIAFQCDLTGVPKSEQPTELLKRFLAHRSEK